MKTLKRIIGSNLLTNCLVNTADVSTAEDIFGPDEGILCGKTARNKPQEVKSMHVNLPMELIAKYQSGILFADYMFVNGVPFFNTCIRDIKLINSRQQDPKIDLTMQAMKSINAYYSKRVFKIVELRSDHKFELAREALADMEIDLNASARNEHVPEIERLNRTTKDRIRSV